jgi:hypothetical protein
MLHAIYLRVMKTIYERSNRNYKSNFLVDIQLAKFNERHRNSKQYYVTPSGNGIFQVQIPNTRAQYIVNLYEKKCDCTHFFEYQSPYTHAIAAC